MKSTDAKARSITRKGGVYGYLEVEGMTSAMNTTKWMECFSAFNELALRCRIKFLDMEEPTRWAYFWVPRTGYIEGPFTPVNVMEIEWLEVEPFRRERRGQIVPDKLTDYSEEIEMRLRSYNVIFTWEGKVIRIMGQIRPNSPV